MLKSITINYTAKDFFGHDKLNSDTLDKYGLTPNVIERVCRAVSSGRAHAAHFIHDDGQCDTVYRDYGDEDGWVTHRHDIDEWNRDAPVKVQMREFKRRMKAELV